MTRQVKIKNLENDLKSLKGKKENLMEMISQESKFRVSGEDRDAKLERHKYLTTQLSDLNKTLEGYKDRDPATLEKKKVASKIAKDSGNRWTGTLIRLTR